MKAMLRYAYENNYTTNDDFKRREFKVYKENVENGLSHRERAEQSL